MQSILAQLRKKHKNKENKRENKIKVNKERKNKGKEEFFQQAYSSIDKYGRDGLSTMRNLEENEQSLPPITQQINDFSRDMRRDYVQKYQSLSGAQQPTPAQDASFKLRSFKYDSESDDENEIDDKAKKTKLEKQQTGLKEFANDKPVVMEAVQFKTAKYRK